jgi:hypothetical protein
MERLLEIEAEYRIHCRRLEDAYAELRDQCAGDLGLFARHWRLLARSWSFDDLNDLIRDHNRWYPIESNLPMDPRTRDYVPIRGASYRRIELGPDWVLEHFPASDGVANRSSPPRQAPREPYSWRSSASMSA